MSDEPTKFNADYAASNRSKCNRCRQPIAQGELRIGPMVQSDKGDFKYPAWHHFACFEDGWMKKNPGAFVDVQKTTGIDRLKFEDQKRIKSLVVGGDSNLETKAISAEEKAIAADSKAIWAKKAKLEEMENTELVDLLEHNRQPAHGKIHGGRGKTIDRLAEAMVFGCLEKCPNCPDGDLILSHGEFKCTGAMDEFAKCEYTTKNPKRFPMKIPKYLASNYTFLKNYTFKERTKAEGVIEGKNPVMANRRAAADAVGAKRQRNKKEEDGDTDSGSDEEEEGDETPAAEDGAATVDNTPFYGCAVIFAGKLSRTQVALKKLITDNGGTVATTIGQSNICVCTKEEAVGNGSQKGRDALKAKLLCLDEAWMDECIKAGKRIRGEDMAKYVLANPQTKDATREQRRAAGDKLELQRVAQEEREKLQENFNEKAQKSSGTKKLVVKGSSAVDPDSELVDEGHIYEPKMGEIYNATLNLADVSTGQNSFYILQLIEHDNKKRWTVFRKWGKVGNDKIGSNKITSYTNTGAALREFEKVFEEKTGNPWANRKKGFKKVYGKFLPVDMDYTTPSGGDATDASGKPSAGLADSTGYNGPLDVATQQFVQLIFDIKVMNDTLKEMEIDTEKMPLGRLSKTTIADGFKALSALQKLLQSVDDFSALDKTAPERTRAVSLTNQFYHYIPHAAEDGKALPMLDTLKLIEKKVELLTTLQDLEVASKMISTSDAPSGAHPIDVHYQKLKTDFRTVAHKSSEFDLINRYLQDTHASTHNMYTLELVDLWGVDREGEGGRFDPFAQDHNRQLLWHGSRLANWGGILSQGLRIAPPEAPSTGYMFGKGVYFADMSSKSANYCFTTSDKTTGIMMLAEVALGDMYELKHAFYVDGLKKPYKSAKGLGRTHPDPKSKVVMENGTVIPTGKGVPSNVQGTTLMYNEFIVYDVSQIRIRYVLRLNFKYKGKHGTFH